MRAVCVYCGSSTGRDPAFAAAAHELGTRLAEEGIEIVYGGGAVGLMGIVADAAIAAGGRVTGVIPKDLFSKEVGHTGLTQLIEVASLHERKLTMFENSDAFVALPGGIGTLEELTEITTWAQLRIHTKPVFTLDVGGFWRPLHVLLDHLVEQGFMKARGREAVVDVPTVDALLKALGEQ